MACDQNGIHERTFLYLFQFFLCRKVGDHLVSKISGNTDPMDATNRELPRSYLEVFHYLFETYDTADVITDSQQGLMSFKESSNVITESDLLTKFERRRTVMVKCFPKDE